MGQTQEKPSRNTQEPSNTIYSNDDNGNNNISMSCLKSPDHGHTPRKHRVTFDQSSRNNEDGRITPINLPQRTLSIQPRERLIDGSRKSPSSYKEPVLTKDASNSPVLNRARKDPDTYRRSLRLALSRGSQVPKLKKEKDFTKTNGFHEELFEQSVDEVPSRSPHAPRNRDDPPRTPHGAMHRDDPSRSPQGTTNRDDPSRGPHRAMNRDDPSRSPQGTMNRDDPSRSPQGAMHHGDPSRSPQGTMNRDDPSRSPQGAMHHGDPSRSPQGTMNRDDPSRGPHRGMTGREDSPRSPHRAAGSYTTTYQVHDDDKRCSSDQSFWSSDYSTSVGGNSERSNDSSDQGNLNEHHNLDLVKPKPQNFEEFLKKGSKEKPVANNESLQERLRQRLSIFQNEHIVPERKTTPTDINSLPEHILLSIFSYLSTKYLCMASGVCRMWHMLCWDPQLWRSMKISKYSESNFDKVLFTILSRLARSTQGLCLTLQSIRIVQCECLSDRGLSYIAKYCIDLGKLEILACPCVMNRGVQSVLENCLSLTWLDVRGCSCINSICHSMITNIQSSNDTSFRLTYLDISDCVAVDDLGLRTLSFTCKRLETLHMRRCPRITDVGMQHVASHSTVLRELSISDCHKVRDFSLKEISRNCPSLRYLSLMRCAVTDAGIKMIAKGCSNLRYLNVRACAGVTDVGVVYVAQNCLKLRSLDVGKCVITNNTLSALGIHCPQLKRLSIKGCRNLTDVGIRAVVAQCCLLHYLNVEDCSITLDTYEFIREHCQSCVIEHTTLDI